MKFLKDNWLLIVIMVAIGYLIFFKETTIVNNNQEIIKSLEKQNEILLLDNDRLKKVNDTLLQVVSNRERGEYILINKISKDINNLSKVRGSFDKIPDDSILVVLRKAYENSIKHSTNINK